MLRVWKREATEVQAVASFREDIRCNQLNSEQQMRFCLSSCAEAGHGMRTRCCLPRMRGGDHCGGIPSRPTSRVKVHAMPERGTRFVSQMKRRTHGPYPCLTAQVLKEMAIESSTGSSADLVSRRLSRREGLAFHLVVFVLGAWNLAIINLARSPHDLWFWPWVAGWAALFALHLVYLATTSLVRIHPNVPDAFHSLSTAPRQKP